MVTRDVTYVIGHRNPDMDAIASAIGYAWLLNQTQSETHVAARAGEVNAQTRFALQHFRVDVPQLLIDVRARVQDVLEHIPALQGDVTILQACQHYARMKRSVPLLDADEKPEGLLTSADLLGYLVHPIVDKQAAKLQQALQQPATDLLGNQSIVLRASDYLSDAIQRIRFVDPDDYLVVDASGHYLGLCRTGEMLTMPRQKLILVDHNEVGQAVIGVDEAAVIEVLDHHRVNTIETLMPIRFQIETVGSCSTLVFEQGQSHHLSFPAELAGVLLCGILSDTLVFQSPTTTERDRQAAYELARMANLSGDVQDAVQTLGRKLLMAGAGLGTRLPDEIVKADLKFYEINRQKIAISQVEVTSFETVDARLPELQTALEKLLHDENLILALLMITDILRGDSYLVVEGSTALVAHLPFSRLPNGAFTAPGIVSRKKQLAPMILAGLDNS